MQLCCTYEPTLNGSIALQRFEHGNTVDIRNGIMFDFYPGLPHVYWHSVSCTTIILHVCILQLCVYCNCHCSTNIWLGHLPFDRYSRTTLMSTSFYLTLAIIGHTKLISHFYMVSAHARQGCMTCELKFCIRHVTTVLIKVAPRWLLHSAWRCSEIVSKVIFGPKQPL